MKKVYFQTVSQVKEALRDNVPVYYENCIGTHRVIEVGTKLKCERVIANSAERRIVNQQVFALV